MTLNGEITGMVDTLDKHKKIHHGKVLLQEARAKILAVNSEIQTMVDAGVFDILEPEIKAVFAAAWTVCKNAKTGFENEAIAELLDWVPEPPEPPE